MSTLSDFIGTERHQYGDEGNNLFTFSLGQASRYYDFILIVAERHKVSSQSMVLNSQELMASLTVQSTGTMSNEQMRRFKEQQQLATLVHLEIESFYLFAKIFLDKIAFFLQNYFGQAHGISLISHDRLTKFNDQFRLAKGLVYPAGFSESLLFLKGHVCDYRDKQISHLQNPRVIKGTSYGPSGQTRIVASFLYPAEQDTHVQSKELPELINAIDVYIQQVIEVISLNRGKTRFKLIKQSGTS